MFTDRARDALLPSHSSETPRPPSLSEAEGTSSDSAPWLHVKYDMLKLLEAAAKFRSRNGIRVTRPRVIPDFLKEVRDFVPTGLSERQLFKKLLHEKHKFRLKPSPASDWTDSDRRLYELELRAWGPCRDTKSKPGANGLKKRNKKGDVTKKKQKGSKEDEEVKEDSGPSEK